MYIEKIYKRYGWDFENRLNEYEINDEEDFKKAKLAAIDHIDDVIEDLLGEKENLEKLTFNQYEIHMESKRVLFGNENVILFGNKENKSA